MTMTLMTTKTTTIMDAEDSVTQKHAVRKDAVAIFIAALPHPAADAAFPPPQHERERGEEERGEKREGQMYGIGGTGNYRRVKV